MRRLLFLSLPALCGLVLPAQAAPTVSVEKGSEVTFTVVTSRGRAVLDLLASTPSQGGTPRVRVRLVPEGTSSARRLYGEVPAVALTTRGGTTTLTTRLGDLSLRVVWREEQYTSATSLGDHDDDEQGTAGWTITGVSASAKVTLGGLSCGVATFAAVGDAVAYDTNGYGAPLARGLGLPRKGLRCFGEQSSLLPVP